MRFYEFIVSRPKATLSLNDEMLLFSNGRTSKTTLDDMLKSFITPAGGFAVSGPQGNPGPTGPQGPVGPTGGVFTYTQDTTPITPLVGHTWFDTTNLTEWIYYYDGDQYFWVQTNGTPTADPGFGLGLKADLTGATFTGNINVTKSSPYLTLDATGTNDSGVLFFKDDGVIRWAFYRDGSGGPLRIRRYDAAGVNQSDPIIIDTNGNVVMDNANTVSVPVPTASTNATTKLYVDTADATKAGLTANNTFTGALNIVRQYPTLKLQESVAGASYVTYAGSNGFPRVHLWYQESTNIWTLSQYDSAGVFVRSPIVISSDGRVIFGSAVGVVVPVPTLSTHAAQKADVDTKVAKTGDTITGDLTMSKATARIVLSGIGFPGIEMKDAAFRRALIYTDHTANAIKIAPYDAGGAGLGTGIVISTTTGGIAMSGAPSVSVPVATAATHAAQVTAIDAATGRLAIGGVEMGNTGWRNVLVDLGAGFTATVLTIGRQGNRVNISWNNLKSVDGNPDGEDIYVLPSGFGCSNKDSTVYFALGNIQRAANSASYQWSFGCASNVRATKILGGDSTTAYWNGGISFLTDQAWPTTLPGTAA